MKKQQTLSLALFLVLLAFTLRVYRLDSSGFWQDEGLTPLRAAYSVVDILSNRVIIQEGITQDTHPPLYFLLIHFSRQLLGESDFAFRYPSVLAGVLLIPLLFRLGVALRGRGTGLLAALLAAANPAQIWYAQEARMYTLLALLGAASSYALWRALSGRRLERWFAVYAFFAILAFLTHYTAIFLIGAHALYWLWLLWRRGRQKLIIAGAIIGAVLATPFIPFIVPRLFTGAEANYFYVSPLIMLQDVVHGFGMGLTADFSLPAIRLLDVAVALLLTAGMLAWRPRPRLFLLIYLLAVVAGLALGSLLLKPMYQGIRHIFVGSPAFFLLLARGIEGLPGRPRLLPVAGLVVALLGPAIALDNLYRDPAYAKDDLRALIRHVEERAGGNDVVLYNDAINLPLHEHYAERPALPVTALPVYPYPAGEQTAERLAGLAERYDRIWFFSAPPADTRDEHGFVQQWLESELVPLEGRGAPARTTQIEVTAFDTRPAVMEALPPGARRTEREWPETPSLAGWRAGFAEPASLPTLWLDLFWKGPELSVGQAVRFVLRDEAGGQWLDYHQPLAPEEWPQPQGMTLARVSYGLPVRPGTPPGTYELLVRPWEASTGATLGDWQSLGSVGLADTGEWPAAPRLPLAGPWSLQFQNGVRLLGLSQEALEVRPGHALPLRVYWEGDSSVAGSAYELQIVGPDGEVWFQRQGRPGPDWLAPEAWPAEAPVAEDLGFLFPADAPTGAYRLRWRLQEGGGTVPARPSWRPWYSEWVTFGQIDVRPWPLETTLPDAEQIVEAQFGPSILLYGYDLLPEPVEAGETMTLTLYWQARERPARDLMVFVHLVNEAGEIVEQVDRIPVEGLRMTGGWRPGEVLVDPYRLPIPAGASGVYRLYTGLFDPESGTRPMLTVGGEVQADGRLLLATFTLP